MRVSHALPLLLLVFAILAGCTPPWERSGARNKPAFRPGNAPENYRPAIPGGRGGDEEAVRFVHNALMGIWSVSTLQSSVAMKAVDGDGDFTFSCRAELLIQRPASLRLTATKGLALPVLDLSVLDSALDIWLPRKRTLYRGRIDDLRGVEADFHPEEFIDQILLPRRAFEEAAWNAVGQGQAGGRLFEAQDAQGWRDRLEINAATLAILRRERLRPDGSVALMVAYTDHAPLAVAARSVLFPHRIDLEFPEERRVITIRLRRSEANPALTSADFWILVPTEGVTIRPFGGASDRAAVEEMRAEMEEGESKP